jgi:phospholipid/cholesterol/gamma-HCH transport system substrate-binding protein
MDKSGITVGRIITMVVFALSCFGLLLFLWLAFGGAIPLKPKGYRFTVAVPEANQLSAEADVRSSGVTIGKVKTKEQAPGGNRTLVEVELERKYAPLDADARVIQRTKTILGERYLEVTRGRPGGPTIPEGGRLPDAAVERTVELDEVLGILDAPTRALFRTWQQDLGAAARPSGESLSDAFGSLPEFMASGTDLLQVLEGQEQALAGLIRNTGVTFGALTEREDQLRSLVVNVDEAFSATAQEKEALAETFQIFPTFLDESRALARNLETFSGEARPVIRDLRPAIADLRPALRDVRALSPDLERFFRELDPLITASQEGLPALRDTLRGLQPVLGQVQPFLEELNPILEWLEFHQHSVADFFANGGGALVDTNAGQRTPEERGHYLGQYGLTGEQSVVAGGREPRSSRGNAYLSPEMQEGPRKNREMILPSWRCDNTPKGEHTTPKGGTSDEPSCWIARLPGPTRFPHIQKADYSR